MAKKSYLGINNKAKKNKKIYIGIESFVKRDLPSGYTQVAYIQSNGTQHVNTGFKPKYNSRIVLDVSDIPTSANYIFGSKDANSATAANQFGLYRNSATQLRVDYFGTNKTVTLSDATQRTTIDMNANVVKAYGQTITATAVNSGEVSRDLYLFALHSDDGAIVPATMKLYLCQIYDNGTLVRDYVPCTNPSGTAGLYDMVNKAFNAGVGTFIAGSSVESVARRIKKGYIGIGGVARPFMSGGELAYYGKITDLSVARRSLVATTIGGYALFAGGEMSGTGRDEIDTYDASLTKGRATNLSGARSNLAATTVGNYALFGGGIDEIIKYATVDTYNTSLTKGTATALSGGRYDLAATSVGDYALFGGGSGGSWVTADVDVYNISLTHSLTFSSLGGGRSNLTATTVGDYALFGGGMNDAGFSRERVDAYDKSLTQHDCTSLSVARYDLAATTVGNYALFGGGYGGSGKFYATVDAYDKALTRTTATSLSVARLDLATTTVGDYALFSGGCDSDTTPLVTVDVYDKSLTRTTMSLSKSKAMHAATTIGNYALFGGGESNEDGYTATVEAFVAA